MNGLRRLFTSGKDRKKSPSRGKKRKKNASSRNASKEDLPSSSPQFPKTNISHNTPPNLPSIPSRSSSTYNSSFSNKMNPDFGPSRDILPQAYYCNSRYSTLGSCAPSKYGKMRRAPPPPSSDSTLKRETLESLGGVNGSNPIYSQSATLPKNASSSDYTRSSNRSRVENWLEGENSLRRTPQDKNQSNATLKDERDFSTLPMKRGSCIELDNESVHTFNSSLVSTSKRSILGAAVSTWNRFNTAPLEMDLNNYNDDDVDSMRSGLTLSISSLRSPSSPLQTSLVSRRALSSALTRVRFKHLISGEKADENSTTTGLANGYAGPHSPSPSQEDKKLSEMSPSHSLESGVETSIAASAERETNRRSSSNFPLLYEIAEEEDEHLKQLNGSCEEPEMPGVDICDTKRKLQCPRLSDIEEEIVYPVELKSVKASKQRGPRRKQVVEKEEPIQAVEDPNKEDNGRGASLRCYSVDEMLGTVAVADPLLDSTSPNVDDLLTEESDVKEAFHFLASKEEEQLSLLALVEEEHVSPPVSPSPVPERPSIVLEFPEKCKPLTTSLSSSCPVLHWTPYEDEDDQDLVEEDEDSEEQMTFNFDLLKLMSSTLLSYSLQCNPQQDSALETFKNSFERQIAVE